LAGDPRKNPSRWFDGAPGQNLILIGMSPPVQDSAIRCSAPTRL
jgi:hypothetical protein